MITLNQIKLNQEVKIHKIECIENIKRRMLDLGMIEGTTIKPVLQSAIGDLVAYEIRGTLISIRKQDAKNITIELK